MSLFIENYIHAMALHTLKRYGSNHEFGLLALHILFISDENILKNTYMPMYGSLFRMN